MIFPDLWIKFPLSNFKIDAFSIVMTLELQKPSFSSSAVKNSSFDISDYELGSKGGFDFQEVIAKANKRKENFVLSPSEKKSSDSGFSERRQSNMVDRYSDDYDSYEEDFEDESSSPQRGLRDRSSKTGRYSRYSTRTRSPDISTKRNTRHRSRNDSLASYRSSYGNKARGTEFTNIS